MKIRIGHLSTFYHTAVLLMARGELTARLDEEIEWRLLGTGPAIMQAFGRGELDLAYIGLPPAMIGMEQGIDVVCVAGGHREGTVMAGKTAWQGVSELGDAGAVMRQFAGRTIGVPGKGSIHDVILKDCIARHAADANIAVRNFPWSDQVTEAVATGEVAAAFGTPCLAVAIERFAGGRLLIPPRLLWPGNPSYGIVVDREFLRRHRDIVRRFLVVHELAEEALRRDPAGAAGDIARHVAVVDADFVLDTLRLSPGYCAALPDGYVSTTMEFMREMVRMGFLRKELPPERIFDRTLIREVHPGPDHYLPETPAA